MVTYTIEELIEFNHDLRVSLLSKWQQHTPQIEEGKAWPLLYLGVQVANLHEAIELLASKGLDREAGILLRSLLEATINVMWITRDPENRLDRYAAYRYITTERDRELGEHFIRDVKWTEAKRAMSSLCSKLAHSPSYIEGIALALGETATQFRDTWSERVKLVNNIELGMHNPWADNLRFPDPMDADI